MPKKKTTAKDFSVELEEWFHRNQSKTVGDLLNFFEEKSFAILFLLFMFIPALPIPTGGITTFVLVPAVLIASLQMVFGRRALWMPKKINEIKINSSFLKSAIPFMIHRIRWLEKFSRPRVTYLFDNALFRIVIGLIVFILTLAVQIAPPFSALDTLPSMGVVLIALGVILGDIVFFFGGIVVGIAGLGALVAAASAITLFFQKIF